MPELISLPIELLVEVAEYLGTSDKIRLSQTCSHSHAIIMPTLYRNVAVDMFYHTSDVNDMSYLSVMPSKGGGKRIPSPIHALAKYGGHVRTLTIRVSRMSDNWSRTDARRSRVAMKMIKRAILKCENATKLQLFSGSSMDSRPMPETIHQPYELFDAFLRIAEAALLSFKRLKEVGISCLADIHSYENRRFVFRGLCYATLATLSNIRIKINGKSFQGGDTPLQQISDALDGITTTIHTGNIDPASRRCRSTHPDIPQSEDWYREVRRLNSSLDALSPESTPDLNPGEVHFLNLLCFPTDENTYTQAIPHISRFQELKELWVCHYEAGSEPSILWEETFPGLVNSLQKLQLITYRRFFRDSDEQHKNEWRMVENRYKVDRYEGKAAKYGSVRDEFYRLWYF